MTGRQLYPWMLAAGVIVLAASAPTLRPADAQGAQFPVFFRGGRFGAGGVARAPAEFAVIGTRNSTIHLGITLTNPADAGDGTPLVSQSLVVGRGTARRGTFRIGVRNPDGANDAGNRAFGRVSGSIEANNGSISGRADVFPYPSRPFAEATLFRPQDEKANADLQGDWISAFREDGDDFRLTLRGNRLILKGTEVQFGAFEFQGVWSALTDTDGFPLIGLVPTKVRVPVDDVLAFDAANLPDPVFGFILPDDPDILVIFLGIDRITGDEVRTVLRRLDRNTRTPGSAGAPAVRSRGLGTASAAKSRTKFGAQ